MKNKSFTFHSSWFDAISNQPDHVRLALMEAICRYAIYGEVPQDTDPVVQMAFVLIRAEIDRTLARRKRTKPIQQEEPAEPPTTAVPDAPADTAQETADPVTADSFDADFDAVAEKLRNSQNGRDWLKNKLLVRDFDTLFAEMKEHIRSSGRTAEFAGGTMSATDLYLMISAAAGQKVFSRKALTPYA